MLDAAERADFARKLVSESAGDDPLDERNPLDRDILGPQRVRLEIPTRSPEETRRVLLLLSEQFRGLAMTLERAGPKDQRLLMGGVQDRIRRLNLKINAYRKPRTWRE